MPSHGPEVDPDGGPLDGGGVALTLMMSSIFQRRARGVLIRFALCCALAGRWAFAQVAITPRLDSASLEQRNGQVRFQFSATQGSTADFQVLRTHTLGPANGWELATNATVIAITEDLYRASLPADPQPDAATFLQVRRLGPPPIGMAPRLNEVMTDNRSALSTPSGEFWDWIELHNPHDEALDLSGFGLSDDPAQPGRWKFPAVTLQPDGYLLVYASGLNQVGTNTSLHTDFRLSASGDTLVLTDPFEREVDRLELPALAADQSLGRAVDAPEQWQFYAPGQTTPGRENPANSPAPLVDSPRFSPVGGFHAGSVDLQIRATAPGQVVRFTTDGTAPGATSLVFSDALRIEQPTVVRAVVVDAAGHLSEEVGQSYLVGITPRLPVISLATDPANFAFRTGYLTGMGSQVLSAQGEVLQSYPYSGSNAWKDREIEVHLEMFEPDGRVGLRQRAGLKVYGGWGSRGYPQKSYALFARRQYGAARFHHRIFPNLDLEEFESFVLRNSGNDNQSTHQTPPHDPIQAFGPTKSYGSYFVNGTFTLMRDAMMQRLLVEETGLDTQAYRPAVLYVNGEYWGLTNLREKLTESYVEKHHDLPAGKTDLIEGYGDVRAGTVTAYRAMRDFITTHSPAIDTNYTFIARQYLELDNFIDYHLAVLYFQNFDIGNIKCWRPRVEGGRFRWIVYDQDYGFGLWPAAVYVPAMARDYADYANMFRFATAGSGTSTGWPNAGGRTLLLRRMLLNPEFRGRFISRCADLLNGPFRAARVESVIQDMAAVIRPEIPAHLARWSWSELQKRGYGAPYKEENEPLTQALWETHVKVLIDFARQRPDALRADCEAYFQLAGGRGEVQVDVTPEGAGYVRVNTLAVREFPWSGTYFVDQPVRLLPVAQSGYRFAGWTSARGDEEVLAWQGSVARGETNRITARFEKLPDGGFPAEPLRVTEINYHSPDDLDADDWIELYNPGEGAVNLEGWTLRDRDEAKDYFLPRLSLAPKAYGVLCRNLAKFRLTHPQAPEPLAELGFRLGNEGDRVLLRDGRGVPVVDLTYDDRAPWPEAADGQGATLQLARPDLDPASAAAWNASATRGGTPGAP